MGAVEFSGHLLQTSVQANANIVGVITQKTARSNSDHLDLGDIAGKSNIPVGYFDAVNSKEALEWVKGAKPGVIFCFGWSWLIREGLLNLPKLGVIGYRPSALLSNCGRHPFPRGLTNIQALATMRGAQSNFEDAEAFFLLKEMV